MKVIVPFQAWTMMWVRPFLAVLMFGFAPSLAATDSWNRESEQPFGPSYDCDQQQAVLELTICSDPLLSRLELALSVPLQAMVEETPAVSDVVGTDARANPSTPSSNALEKSQEQGLKSLSGSCDLDFNFRTDIGARYRAVRCLINSFVHRLSDLGRGQLALDALAEVGVTIPDGVDVGTGDSQIDLPRILSSERKGTVAGEFHPACLRALLEVPLPSSLRRSACSAGTSHLPLESHYHEPDGLRFYSPWNPGPWPTSDDEFSYVELDKLDDGSSLLKVTEEYWGNRSGRFESLVVAYGLADADVVTIKAQIHPQSYWGYCGHHLDLLGVSEGEGKTVLRLGGVVSAGGVFRLFDQFPNELDGMSDSEKDNVRAMTEGPAFDVAMSITSATCIGRVEFDYDLQTTERELVEVVLDIEEEDRAVIAAYAGQTCLFDFLLGSALRMSARVRPRELEGMAVNVLEKCGYLKDISFDEHFQNLLNW